MRRWSRVLSVFLVMALVVATASYTGTQMSTAKAAKSSSLVTDRKEVC